MDIFQIYKKGLESVGDSLAYFLTLFPCWFLAIWGSPELAVLWLLALLAQIVIIHVLKFIFNFTSLGKRPNGYNFAFPSVHTSNSFFGAMWLLEANAFPDDPGRILISSGWFILAGFVGYSRIHAKRHHLRDVIAGAILGTALAFIVFQFNWLNYLSLIEIFTFLDV